MNKLIVLVLVLAVGWFFREPLEGVWNKVKEIPPRVQTGMDMRGQKEGLRVHIERRGGPPADLAAWIDDNVPPKGPGQKASEDRWGNPFQLNFDRQRDIYVLRSCGSDGQCFTEDDLTVDIVPN